MPAKRLTNFFVRPFLQQLGSTLRFPENFLKLRLTTEKEKRNFIDVSVEKPRERHKDCIPTQNYYFFGFHTFSSQLKATIVAQRRI